MRSETEEESREFKYKGKTLKLSIHREECFDGMNPRTEWDNLGHMVCWHRRYNLGDKHSYSDPDQFKEEILDKNEAVVVLPLYLYDHGGITMSIGKFSCPWDSGQVGYIYVTREDIKKEYGKLRWTKKKIEQILESEVKVYDQYLTGDVHGWIVEDEDGENIDSCWGYYGSEKKDLAYMYHEAEEAAKWHIKEQIKKEKTEQQLQLAYERMC